jgi:phenylacetic acid degradation operon negative regulatory protein
VFLHRISQYGGVTATDTSPPQLALPAASARALLLTVLGEFAFPDNDEVWTTALVRVLGGLGVDVHAARQAIARTADAGWIESERSGRAVRWRMTAEGRAVVEEGLARAATFLQRQPAWDGNWLVLLVSVPQRERMMRKRLYGGLTWLGMGNPTPGVWLTPHAGAVDELRSLIDHFGLTESALAFVGRAQNVGMNDTQIVRRAWNLSDLTEQYRTVLAHYRTYHPSTGDDVMLSYLRLCNLLQRFMRLDPQLPEELVPNWLGHEAAELFRTRREQWSAAARERWHDLMREAEQRR